MSHVTSTEFKDGLDIVSANGYIMSGEGTIYKRGSVPSKETNSVRGYKIELND
jgi:hypothetical protein